MKRKKWFPFILCLMVGCHPDVKKTSPEQALASDTTKTNSQPVENRSVKDTAIFLRTHLRDTLYADGNFILFLRPDNARYEELNSDPDGGASEGDSDFGAGIANTLDSLSKNERYKDVKAFTSTRRYIVIKDCKDGPLIVDRDSVNYGVVLSARGKQILATYNSVHSGDYLGEIDEYFYRR